MKKIHRIKSIGEFHSFRNLGQPEHPLISVINISDIPESSGLKFKNLVFDFYSISLKRNYDVKFKYGQEIYDFDDGILFFMAPNQVFGIESTASVQRIKPSGWMLLIHPDFLWNSSLARSIQQYEYFGYSANEALFLSDKEEETLTTILKNIQHEARSNIDEFSQNIIVSQIELLLNYGERFYRRQFITRKITNHKILEQLELFLTEYFEQEDLHKKGLPTVKHIAQKLNVTPNYLSGLLKMLTGSSTQQHIHNKLIQKAKEKLSTTDLSVTEIARTLGFGYSQSFNKFFKEKTNLSPLEFRRSFH